MKDAAGNADGSAEVGFAHRPLWGLMLLALMAGQTAATLALFGPDRSWRNVVDDRPIMNGRHPLHLYHGFLGAQSWRDGGVGSCYDPAFQAGYPKTPIFDSGSRPAELFLLLGSDRHAAYKLGMAICCALAPLAFAAAARLLELPPATACLAAGLGLLTWWGTPTQRLLEQGDLDWVFAGLLLLIHAALVVRFHRHGGPIAWIGLLLTATAGWFLHPVLWLGFGLLFVSFSVCVALSRHWLWSAALWMAWGGGLALNSGWLHDWVKHCWIQRPVAVAPGQQVSNSVAQWWLADLNGEQPDRLFAAALLAGGLVGVLGLVARRRYAAGLTIGATALLLPVLSAGSGFWEPLEGVGAAKLFMLACAFAVVPCAAALVDLCVVLGWLTRHRHRGAALGLALLAGALAWQRDPFVAVLRQAASPTPLRLGLMTEQQTLIRRIRESTRPDARILWEERPNHPTPGWTALLPLHLQRSFLGGLDPDADVDHMFARMSATHLAGRPFTDWSDAELAEFCNRYNVGYVVCWSPQAEARWRAWAPVEVVISVREMGAGSLLSVKRTASFVLKGKARVVQCDSQRIALADVEPDDGELVLSLHYQEGFHFSPATVHADRVIDAHDPIPLLRLHIPGPMLRLTLTWAKP